MPAVQPWEIGDRIGFGRWGGYRQITSPSVLRYGSDERKVFAVVAPDQANLVAATPVLHDTLKKIEKRLFAFGNVQQNLDRHDVSIMLDWVRTALAAAEGETQ
jgi:hypothetical protein